MVSKLPEEVDSAVTVTYRSAGLGVWGTLIRAIGMPLEKIALTANSAQVSGQGQYRQAFKITFEEGWAAPFRVLTARSGIAWFLQYSIMGFTFQIADRTLSKALNVDQFQVSQLKKEVTEEDKEDRIEEDRTNNIHEIYETRDKDLTYNARYGSKMILAPLMATSFESLVSNKAEGIRFYGPEKFTKIEASKLIKQNIIKKAAGPAYVANVGRNFLMCSSAFIWTPFFFAKLPEDYKTSTNLFWFGLLGNWTANLAAVQCQSLWGRSLDYMAVDGGRPINYSSVIREGLKKEGFAAFFTPTKYCSRVLMNCPAQGTIPWFYNSVLPIAEPRVKGMATGVYNSMF